MAMQGLNSHNTYRYAFQGQERDDEVKGAGNSYNYKYRMHDSRLGRFFAVDPLTHKYPHYSPYSFSGNKTIAYRELEGLEEIHAIVGLTDNNIKDGIVVAYSGNVSTGFHNVSVKISNDSKIVYQLNIRMQVQDGEIVDISGNNTVDGENIMKHKSIAPKITGKLNVDLGSTFAKAAFELIANEGDLILKGLDAVSAVDKDKIDAVLAKYGTDIEGVGDLLSQASDLAHEGMFRLKAGLTQSSEIKTPVHDFNPENKGNYWVTYEEGPFEVDGGLSKKIIENDCETNDTYIRFSFKYIEHTDVKDTRQKRTETDDNK